MTFSGETHAVVDLNSSVPIAYHSLPCVARSLGKSSCQY